LLLSQLLRAPVGSRLVRTDLDGDTLTLGIATTDPRASCPTCGHETWRIHSRYTRCLAEEPIFGHRVRLRMTVRRFLCPDQGCPRRIFVEPLDGFAARHARTTARLDQLHLAIGSALGGEAGARLAGKAAVPTSPDTLLRRVKRAGPPPSGTPRLVGIDDWAWCKGQRYGTIVVDLETGDVIDLLPDRDAATVKAWLEAHPGVELISRDRSSAYSQAAAEAAPEARQVADRWHLLKNVREAVERFLERHLPRHHRSPQARRCRSGAHRRCVGERRCGRRDGHGADDGHRTGPAIAVTCDSGLAPTGGGAGHATAACRPVRAGP
jgi:transposase